MKMRDPDDGSLYHSLTHSLRSGLVWSDDLPFPTTILLLLHSTAERDGLLCFVLFCYCDAVFFFCECVLMRGFLSDYLYGFFGFDIRLWFLQGFLFLDRYYARVFFMALQDGADKGPGNLIGDEARGERSF